eukprot:PhM_4_TR13322/c1_g1_i1/m.72668
MQMENSPYKNGLQAARDMWKCEGLRGFYRGIGLVYVVAGCLSATLFAIQYSMRELLCRMGVDAYLSPSLLEAASAMMSAPMYTAMLTPIEVLKTRMQVNTFHGKTTTLSGTVQEAFRGEGLRVFTKGYLTVCLQRMLGLPAFFGGHSMVKRALMGQTEEEDHTARYFAASMAGGAVGGCLYWVACYPVDLIKTQIQKSSGKERVSVLGLGEIHRIFS